MSHASASAHQVPAILSKKRIAVEKKRSFREVFSSHIRRVLIEVFSFVFNHDWVFRLVGVANRRLKLIESVFLVYPATDDYALAYTYRARMAKIKWSPWLVGFFRQNGKIGVKFAISAHNGDFRNEKSKENLGRVVERMEFLRFLLNAERKTFAGVLPGVLFKLRLVRKADEADVTAGVVVKAIERIRQEENLPENTPVIVIGGRGFVGRRVVSSLPREIACSVDITDGRDNIWPSHLCGKPAIVVNISLNSALEQYLPLFWKGAVVINEVYPEPSQRVERFLKEIGASLYHISGVAGKALPCFPLGYSGGIPCCAAHLDGDMEVLFKRIV